MIAVDPMTLGVAATALVGAFFTKLLEKAGEQAGEKAGDQAAGAVGKLVGWLRDRFSPAGDPAGAAALAKLEEVPDSARLQDSLTQAIAAKAKDDPAFRAELEQLISQARDAGAETAGVVQKAVGDRNVQNANIQGSTITTRYGVNPEQTRTPERPTAAGD